jgi:two-component system alkaline phosphatase synthesis response regulator PhoP
VVDDERSMTLILRQLIEASIQGIHVDVAYDGEEALNKLQQVRPVAIILDILMPKKDGFEVLAELAKRNEDIPIIIYSGYFGNEAQFVGRARPQRSSIAYFEKPTSFHTILSTLRRLIDAQAKKESESAHQKKEPRS